jgi:hypothetical protein
MGKVLSSFSVTAEADGYVLHMEDDDGDTVEYSATLEQLDEITTAIEETLEMDDEDELAMDDDGEMLADEDD